MEEDAEQRAEELARQNAERLTPRYRSLIWHWLSGALRPPKRPAAAPLPRIAPGQVGVSFAGHSTFLIRYADFSLTCDPMLGGWCLGSRRAVKPGLSPSELGGVELVLLSHAHCDHLHRATLAQLPRSATVVLPPRTAQRVSDLGFARVLELAPGQSVEHRGVDITSAAVRHDEDEPALSYVIRGDGPSVFFCGDSAYFDGFAEIGRRFFPEIALLPIGGYAPRSFRARHMSPLDAVYAFEDLGSRIMVPHHFGAFALSYELLGDPRRWLEDVVSERDLEKHVEVLEPGESRTFSWPEEVGASPRTQAEESAEVEVDLGDGKGEGDEGEKGEGDEGERGEGEAEGEGGGEDGDGGDGDGGDGDGAAEDGDEAENGDEDAEEPHSPGHELDP